ncbi:S family protein [Paramicrosporidium saccamoebae]|uniref:S family protein n=1 Tax=Paramicrosporidium saccamoebae TaxID=1246581 RepID=A0A2H9TGV1_9FUNG|nr:S family protein [Paramicrosporidium saccamoebae]
MTLARALIKMEKYEAALIAMNTCPVAPNPEPEAIRILPTTKPWIPRKNRSLQDEVSQSPSEDSILERLKGSRLRGALKQAYDVLVELVAATGWDDLLKLRSRIFLMEEEYRAQRTDRRPSDVSEMEQIPLDDHPPPKTGKRLCERWLDQLFMVLFDDMRVYTIYRGEVQHFRGENMPYQRTAREWLILGTLCRRLAHFEEAKEAYRQCVETAFCEEAWQALLEMYTDEGRLAHALTAVTKLLLHQAGHYQTAIYPNVVGRQIFKMIRMHGVERIRTTMMTLNMGAQVDALLQKYLEMVAAQKCLGHDY